MHFVDEIIVYVRAGNDGNGCNAWRKGVRALKGELGGRNEGTVGFVGIQICLL